MGCRLVVVVQRWILLMGEGLRGAWKGDIGEGRRDGGKWKVRERTSSENKVDSPKYTANRIASDWAHICQCPQHKN